MKKILNLLFIMSVLCTALFQFSPKVLAEKDSNNTLTPQERLNLFVVAFNESANTYTYDADSLMQRGISS